MLFAEWLGNGLEPPEVLTNTRASDTFVLVAPRESNQVSLFDHDGNAFHRWSLDRNTTGMVELLDGGDLLYIADENEGEPKYPAGAGGVGIRRVNWEGDEVWRLDDEFAHHDFEVLADGTIAFLRTYPMQREFSDQIPGGGPDTEADGVMWGDRIIEINPETGTETIIFDVAEALEPSENPLPEWMTRKEWTHANSLTYTESDPVTGQEAYLISFRQISTIAIVSRDTGEIIWAYGGKWVLNQQHDPSFLKNGNILLFDNGNWRRFVPSSSQVFEIDPRTNETEWAFPEKPQPLSPYYSSITSGAQRLENGNTMISYGVPGRLVEVSPEGEVLWDYIPYPGRLVFKARAYPIEYVERIADNR